MKTIEEAAEKYSEAVYFTTESESTEIQQAFISGAKFAQRWIPVEEELPTCNIEDEGICYSEYILLKIKGYEHPYVGFYVKANDDEFFDLIHLKFDKYVKQEDITHWRQIELK